MPNWRINWEEVGERVNENAGTPAPEHFRTATFTGGNFEMQPPNEELDTFDPPEWDTPDDRVEQTPPPLRQKSARFTARIAIGIVIELWTWLADTGAEGEIQWPGWDKCRSYGLGRSFNPLCSYAFNYLKRNPLDTRSRATCNYCPYKKLFGRPCNNRDTHFDFWCRANRDSPRRKEHAQAFLDELLQLQKVIILDPKSVLPGSQQ